MSAQALHDGQPVADKKRRAPIPPDFMRALVVLSVVPAYLIGGALVGYLADRLLNTFPFLTAAGLLVALVFAVRDLLKLRDEFNTEHEEKEHEDEPQR
jgi:F0F1-type ATP synthase assembly protein I